jgi:hypothetical protein
MLLVVNSEGSCKLLKFRAILAWLIVSLVCSGSALAADESVIDHFSEKDSSNFSPSDVREYWFGIYFKNSRVGYVHQQLDQDESYRGFITSRTKEHIELSGGVKVTAIQELLFEPEAPYRLARAYYEKRRGSVTISTSYERGSTGATLTRTSSGTSSQQAFEVIDFTLNDLLAVERTLTSQSFSGSTFEYSSLDTQNFGLKKFTVQVDARGSLPLSTEPSAEFAITLSSKQSTAAIHHLLDGDGRAVLISLGGDFTAKRESRAVARSVSAMADLRDLAQAKIDRRLRQPERIQQLVLELSGSRLETLPTDVRQRLFRDNSSGSLFLQTNATKRLPRVEEPNLAQRYLGDTLDYPVNDDRIRSLSKKALKGAASDGEKIAKLVRFVSVFLEDSDSAHLSVLESIEKRKGNCKDHARLFATLARAAGFPSREVTGLVYADQSKMEFDPHSWNEVYVNGRWVPVDSTFERIGLGPTYISFGSEQAGMTALVSAMGEMVFKVVRVSYQET